MYIAPVLSRIFTPLLTVVLLVFLATMRWTSGSFDGGLEVLIVFHVLLVLVLSLLLYAVSTCDLKGPPDAFDVLQLFLVLAALVAEVVVLAGITARIFEVASARTSWPLSGRIVFCLLISRGRLGSTHASSEDVAPSSRWNGGRLGTYPCIQCRPGWRS